MLKIKKLKANPILSPNTKAIWESKAAFNGCPIEVGKKIHLLYRAMSVDQEYEGVNISLSTIGHAISSDGIRFNNRSQLIKPEECWEKFGCEDPRVTKFNGKYYIFYTALSEFPFHASGIKTAVAITKDFKTIEEKHLVTPFNSKAMTLFPGKIKGKMAAILSVNTDNPPSKIAIALFDNEKQMWSKKYWDEWYANLDEHTILLNKSEADHIEVGAPPILTKDGWLLIYSYIKGYFVGKPVFGVKAVLLDKKDPKKIIAKSHGSLFKPEEKWERDGQVPNIVFPSGALIKKGQLKIYYGGADTVCGVAVLDLAKLIKQMKNAKIEMKLKRYFRNPIIKPTDNAWEKKGTFNAGALLLKNKVHLIYRALSDDNLSVLGYASSKNGFSIDERDNEPIYVPRMAFEKQGCEDPRLTVIGDKVYMLYTAFDGVNSPRVALTSILLKDFLVKKWDWAMPVLISPPGIDDKDAALFPTKFDNKYGVIHRQNRNIDLDFVNSLNFKKDQWIGSKFILYPREGMWDSEKIGIAGAPIKTKRGWLIIYHGISKKDHHYRLGAALLDLNDPTIVLGRSEDPILEPEMDYEKEGVVPNVVFSCGSVLINDELIVYYGGADKVIGVASVNLKKIEGWR